MKKYCLLVARFLFHPIDVEKTLHNNTDKTDTETNIDPNLI